MAVGMSDKESDEIWQRVRNISCCDEFAAARCDGTDGEGYGELVYDYADDGYFQAGQIETHLRFCPWCGTRMDDSKLTHANERFVCRLPKTLAD